MAQAPELDVLGIGNAIVDVLSQARDDFIAAQGLAKGSMTLIDAERAEGLYDAMGPGVEVSGGSCANTMAGLASLGSRAAFVGRVRDDLLGRVFAHDIRAAGVRFETAPAEEGPGTGRCLILVSPDAQRTMSTYLGACIDLGPEHVDRDLVAAAEITYLEGYLWDPPGAKEAFLAAIAAAHGAGRKVALSLSDTFCVRRYHQEFRDLVEGKVDVLFANEQEALELYGASRLDEVVERLRERWTGVAAITRSAEGSVVVSPEGVHEVPAIPVDHVVDTTGAGDLYAAGFLHGLTRRLPLPECARLGGIAAAEVISHFGARPETGLAELAASASV